MCQITISVIVPAYNAEKTLADCLSAIRASDWKDYELIVIDDGSSDGTNEIASRFADRVVRHPVNQGRPRVRNAASAIGRGEIIVNIDSDVIIRPDALARINELFQNDKDIAAATGLLAKQHPHFNFSSQYKNLYMHHMFRRLPRNVSFLYGSIFAIRSGVSDKCCLDLPFAEDTEFGQRLAGAGCKIVLDQNLQVVHLKKYSLATLIKNDFRIPFYWAQLFLKNRGWRQWKNNGAGFAHASRSQLLSLLVVSALIGDRIIGYFAFFPVPVALYATAAAAWLALNAGLFRFLYEERGALFALKSIAYTLLDNCVMVAGIVSGSLRFFYSHLRTDISPSAPLPDINAEQPNYE